MPIEGVIVRDLVSFSDDRGWLMELFRRDENEPPAMSYISATYPGITRGPHEHIDQSDSFCFFSSEFSLTLWDNRSSSRTYKTEVTILAGESAPKNVWVPPGVVHAYRNVGDTMGLVVNFPDQLYKGEGKREAVDEIRHEADPDSPFRLAEVKPEGLPIGVSARFYIPAMVGEAERVSVATIRVKGPWNEPFYVNQEAFEQRFKQI